MYYWLLSNCLTRTDPALLNNTTNLPGRACAKLLGALTYLIRGLLTHAGLTYGLLDGYFLVPHALSVVAALAIRTQLVSKSPSGRLTLLSQTYGLSDCSGWYYRLLSEPEAGLPLRSCSLRLHRLHTARFINEKTSTMPRAHVRALFNTTASVCRRLPGTIT